MAYHAAPLSLGRIVLRVTIGRVTLFIPRERPNVIKHAIAGYLRLYQGLHQCQHWCDSCISTAVEQRNQGTPLAIRPKIMARYKEAAATFGWFLWTSASVPCQTACNWRNRSLMTLPGRGRKVLLLVIIPVPHLGGGGGWSTDCQPNAGTSLKCGPKLCLH